MPLAPYTTPMGSWVIWVLRGYFVLVCNIYIPGMILQILLCFYFCNYMAMDMSIYGSWPSLCSDNNIVLDLWTAVRIALRCVSMYVYVWTLREKAEFEDSLLKCFASPKMTALLLVKVLKCESAKDILKRPNIINNYYK